MDKEMMARAVEKVLARSPRAPLEPIHPDSYELAQELLGTDEPLTYADVIRAAMVELGYCTACLDGSTMPCTECGAGL